MTAVPRKISNRESCEARARSLRQLAEQVREWTAKAAYSSPAELEELVDDARRKLPKVEGIRAVLERDLMGRRMLGLKPQPPAVA